MKESHKRIAGRLLDRMKAGALVAIVQEADEVLALNDCVAVAECYRPVRIISATGRCSRDDVNTGRAGTIVDVGEALMAHPTSEGTLILVDTLINDSPLFARMLREVAVQQRQNGKPSRLILLDRPESRVPAGIVGDADIIVSTLPTVDDLRAELEQFIATQDIEVPGNGEGLHAIASSVAGLPRHEASHLFGRCYVEEGKLDAAWLRREKAIRVTTRLGGALTFESTDGPDIGGAGALREFVAVRGKALGRKDARVFGLPEPKGLFLAGTPGSGKSEFARYVARTLGLALLRLDFGRIFAGLVGESESNMRRAQEAIVACGAGGVVLLLDECDKGFGGVTGASGDSGTTQRVFASFLTFLAENKLPIFVIATANRAWTLPAEFLRSGRFDAVFYLGAPTVAERADIFSIHLNRQGWICSKQSDVRPQDAATFAEASQDFSGAEIRQAVIEAGFAAFAEGRKIAAADVLAAIKGIVPICKTAAEDVKLMEDWAVKAQARRASSPTATVPKVTSGQPLRRTPKIGDN